MKIYTYYENINFKNQNELIDLWKLSWENNGFEAIILNRSHAESHPDFSEFVYELQKIHLEIKNKPLEPYGLSCYLRWLAYATQPEEKFYVSDYDIINNNFKPIEPDDSLHLMDEDCPCIASGSSKQFEDLCKLFVSESKSNISKSRGNIKPHYHDQEFFVYSDRKILEDIRIKMTRERKKFLSIYNYEDILNKTHQVYHLSYNCCNFIKKRVAEYADKTINDIRLKLAKQLVKN